MALRTYFIGAARLVFRYSARMSAPLVVPHPRFCSTALPKEIKDSADFINAGNVVNNAENASTFQDSSKEDQFGNVKVSWEKRRSSKKARKMRTAASDSDRGSEYKLPKKKASGRRDEEDKFGDLSDKNSIWVSPIDDPEPGDDSRLFYPERTFKSAEAYLQQMKALVKEKKLKEALELFPDMKRHNIFPSHANYTFMIGASGRAGYTEMAFKLLKEMSVRGYRPSPATLTGLYNSCAECPFPEYGLKKAHFLKEKVIEKNWLINRLTYHAMIKAFGKCGDLETAFQVVDDMIAAGVMPITATYCFLLISCISDKEAGFTHAVEVWRKMLSRKVQPSIYTFNLLLRATRDCDIGPEETSALLLQHWSSYCKRPYGLNEGKKSSVKPLLQLPNPEFSIAIESGIPKEVQKSCTDGTDNASQSISAKEQKENLQLVEPSDTSKSLYPPEHLPNILSQRPQETPVSFDLSNIQTASNRLALLGSADGFLNLMSHFQISPNIKTFTLLLDSLPGDAKQEDHLISRMDAHGIVPDTDFFNMLIKRRNVRKENGLARNVLLLLNKYNLSPDIVTFGVLALGCAKRKHGLSLLNEMEKFGYHFNVEIIGALIHNASRAIDFGYLEMLLCKMQDAGVQPQKQMIENIEMAIDITRKAILDKEQGKDVNARFTSEKFLQEYKSFTEFYKEWLQTVTLLEEGHPWEQYKTDIVYRGD